MHQPNLSLIAAASQVSIVTSGLEVTMSFPGAQPIAIPQAESPDPAPLYRYSGADPSQWGRHAQFRQATYHGLYPGIDLVLHGDRREVEHDFIVRPGADPSRIRVRFSGQQSLRLSADGTLILSGAAGELRERAPVIYQETSNGRRTIRGRYRRISAATLGFQIGHYDRSLPLVIDPVVYVGGSGNDFSTAMAVDSTGAVYVTGYTMSTNFPAQGPLSRSGLRGASDGFVFKLSADMKQLIWSATFGGTADDRGLAIAVDDDSNVYIAGYTTSSDFPVSSPIQSTFGGVRDAIVMKLNPDGSLAYSTYLGGNAAEEARAIAVGVNRDVYVTGFTSSPDFPVVEPLQKTNAGASDGFVTRINSQGTGLIFSTYLGGSGSDNFNAMTIGPEGHLYIAGATNSTDFPQVGSAAHPAAGIDALFLVLDRTGSEILYSAILGGSGSEIGDAIAVDSGGNIWISGETDSTNLPVTANALQKTYGGNPTDAFLARYSVSPSASDKFSVREGVLGHILNYCTYVGGAQRDNLVSLAPAGDVVNGATKVPRVMAAGLTQTNDQCGGGPAGQGLVVTADSMPSGAVQVSRMCVPPFLSGAKEYNNQLVVAGVGTKGASDPGLGTNAGADVGITAISSNQRQLTVTKRFVDHAPDKNGEVALTDGETVTVEITVTNPADAPDDATGVEIRDEVPIWGLSAPEIVDSGGAQCAIETYAQLIVALVPNPRDRVVCRLGSLARGRSVTIRIKSTVVNGHMQTNRGDTVTATAFNRAGSSAMVDVNGKLNPKPAPPDNPPTSFSDLFPDATPADIVTDPADPNSFCVALPTDDRLECGRCSGGQCSFDTQIKLSRGSFPCCLALRDIDGDGKSDLMVLNQGTGNVATFPSGTALPSGRFGSAVFSDVGTNPLAFLPLTAAGNLYLAILSAPSQRNAPGEVALFRGDASGAWNPVLKNLLPFLVADDSRILADDIDGDGRPDLAIASDGSLSILWGATPPDNPDGFALSAGPLVRLRDPYPYLAARFSAAVGRLHTSGRGRDLVVADGASNTVTVLNNNGLGFVPGITLPLTDTPRGIAAGDFDADGNADVAVISQRGIVSVYRGDGAGGLNPGFTVPVGGRPFALAAGTMEGNPVLLSGVLGPPATVDVARIGTGPAPLSLACPADVGQVGVGYHSAATAEGGVPSYQFYLSRGVDPPGIASGGFDPDGKINLEVFQEGTITFELKVTDSTRAQSGPIQCSITFSRAKPVAGCPVGYGQVGMDYHSAATGRGGVPPYQFDFPRGIDPTGIAAGPLVPDGTITLGVIQEGTVSFNVRVTDSAGAPSDTITCQITFAPPPGTLTLKPASIPGAAVNQAFNFLLTAGNGTAPYSLTLRPASTSQPLPSWLHLDFTSPTTAALRGTAPAAGIVQLIVHVSDRDGHVKDQIYSLESR